MKLSKHTDKNIRQLQERFGILELRNQVTKPSHAK